MVVLFFSLGAGTWAAVKPVDRFSADQVMTVRGQPLSGKIYVDSGNMRTEMQPAGAPEPMVSIVNGARKTLWMIMPGNMYIEKTLDQDEDVSRAAWTSPEKLEPLGRENVDGVDCEKFRVRGDEELFFYVAAKDGLPVRMLSADGKLRIDWKNVKPGPQPASLFELPVGATKFGLPGGFKIPGMR
ncbi:MAG TPA: DUF4412 domain-containing protein [Kiritimatiellia bacterium]|nr:DUF4412 domain-containing protein [Kiritimatiellia bacterium]